MFGLFKKHEVVCETCNQLTKRSWQFILSNAEASDESFREAVAAERSFCRGYASR